MNDALGKLELTASQGRIVGYLARRAGAPCARDIEEEFHLSHPTVSGILCRMEKKGFIQIRPDPRDHRCKRICLLPKGHDSHALIEKTMEENEQTLVRGFTPEEQAQFAAFLNRAITNMGGAPCIQHPKEEPNNHD